MKQLFLAVTALSLAGTIGTANAAPVSVPLNATDLGIWSGATSGAGDPNNNALPSSRALPLVSMTPDDAAAGAIDFNYQAVNNGGSLNNGTIGGFLATEQTGVFNAPGCNATCLGTNISGVQGSFNRATLFEFSFVAPSDGTLVVTHDDGVSLFADLGGGNNPGPTNIFNPADATPTVAEMTETVNLTGGQLYDLFYTAANGLPEVLHTDFVPAPLIGHGLLVLLAVGGALFGGRLLESLKKRHLHAA